MVRRAAREPGGRGFRYQPALDGLRGVAVAMVLVFHAGFSWMSGGYVGVSVFFTLSGYLITSLALVEHDRRGRLDVGAFYGRRIRRLMPASLLCLFGVLVMAKLEWFQDVEHLRRDLWGALAQVANWVDLAGGQRYADAWAGGQATGAPLDHYWSLAIEEQFYWVWPLALLGVLRLSRPRRAALIGALFLIGGIAAPVIGWVWGPDAVYWATPARLPEILAGALLAVVLHGAPRTLPSRVALLAPVGLAVIVVAAVTWPAAGGPAYAGWFPVFAVASAAVLLGLQVESPLRRVLSAPPLVVLGTISYGVYLYHWPIFLVIDGRTGLSQVPLFVVRVAVTLAVATASFVLLERPVRRAQVTLASTARTAAVGVIALACVIAVVPPFGVQLATRSEAVVVAATRPTVTTTSTVAPAASAAAVTSGVPAPPSTAPAGPVRIMILGDSTAMATGDGMVEWANEHPDLAEVVVVASPACGFVRSGAPAGGSDPALAEGCEDVLAQLPGQLATFQPDVAVGMVTMTDLVDRTWTEEEGALAAGDDRFGERPLDEYAAMTDQLITGGVGKVLWVVPPIPDLPLDGPLAPLVDPDVWERYRELLGVLVAGDPDHVALIDLAAWMQSQPEPPERKDGLHWSRGGARELADRYLAPLALDQARS